MDRRGANPRADGCVGKRAGQRACRAPTVREIVESDTRRGNETRSEGQWWPARAGGEADGAGVPSNVSPSALSPQHFEPREYSTSAPNATKVVCAE